MTYSSLCAGSLPSSFAITLCESTVRMVSAMVKLAVAPGKVTGRKSFFQGILLKAGEIQAGHPAKFFHFVVHHPALDRHGVHVVIGPLDGEILIAPASGNHLE